jgi:high-affinity nickel-transport protein
MTTFTPTHAPWVPGWTRQEKRSLAAILGIATLHIGGAALYLSGEGELTGAGGLAGAGVLAYVLGMRHAFDADHIAVIDDTIRGQ